MEQDKEDNKEIAEIEDAIPANVIPKASRLNGQTQ